MHKIPDKMDMEEIALHCSEILAYLKKDHAPDPIQEKMATVCMFVNGMKPHIEWLDEFVIALKQQREERVKNGDA